MLEFLAGLISGIIAALGMGGGTVLILFLTLINNDYTQHLLQGVNLVFFIPTAIIAIILNWKSNLIKFKDAIWIIVFGIAGAIIGSLISFKIDNNDLKKYFGIFLLIIAVLEIITLIKSYISNK